MKVDMWFGNRKQKACLRTVCTHIKNMMTGVTSVRVQRGEAAGGGGRARAHAPFAGRGGCRPPTPCPPLFASPRSPRAPRPSLSPRQGFTYKVRYEYNHFPINVTLAKDSVVEVRNVLGERNLRKVKMHDGVTVTKSDNVKDELVVVGNDIEKVAGSVALLHESCLVRNKDIRKFLDGIYVSERGPSNAIVSVI